jgi:hypothetical protein
MVMVRRSERSGVGQVAQPARNYGRLGNLPHGVRLHSAFRSKDGLHLF